jgi:hypothetical protein
VIFAVGIDVLEETVAIEVDLFRNVDGYLYSDRRLFESISVYIMTFLSSGEVHSALLCNCSIAVIRNSRAICWRTRCKGKLE